MNPKMLLQIQQKLQTFGQEHPKVGPCFNAVRTNALSEGTIIDMKVTTPDGKVMESIIKLTANDIETFRMMTDPGQN